MIKFIKNIVLLLVVVFIIGGIGAGVYFFSPEIKPGEVGILYKMVGNNKGFTGKILTPGKYYAFISDYNPIVNKIYKMKLQVKKLNLTYNTDEGIKFDLKVVYGIDEKNINNFLAKVNKNEADTIIKLYIESNIKELLAKYSANDIFSKSFQSDFNILLSKTLSKDLTFFGIKIDKIFIDKIVVSDNLKKLYNDIKQKEKDLALLKVETEQKLKEAELRNKIKEENLNFLLKKAETEKAIIKAKIESQKLIVEADKERMLQEAEIFSKPGGAIAAKLEAIRLLSKSVDKPEKVLDKLEPVFGK